MNTTITLLLSILIMVQVFLNLQWDHTPSQQLQQLRLSITQSPQVRLKVTTGWEQICLTLLAR